MVFNIRLSRGKWSVVMGKNLYSAFGFEYTHDVGIVHFCIGSPIPFFAILLYDSTMYLVCRLSTRSANASTAFMVQKSLFLSFWLNFPATPFTSGFSQRTRFS